MSDRQLAIDKLNSAPPGSLLISVPGIMEEPGIYFVVTPSEPSYPFFNNAISFDKATKEDICYCIYCGATTLIFEDVCPNCNSAPYPEEYENA